MIDATILNVIEKLETIERHHAMPDGESWESAYNEVCGLAREAKTMLEKLREEVLDHE